MPIEVVRVPADCVLCEATWDLLDQALASGRLFPDVTADDVEHFLTSVLVWWVAQTLAQFDGKVEPLFLCLINALKEQGINVVAMPLPTGQADAKPS